MRPASALLLLALLVACDRQYTNQDAAPESRPLDEPAVGRLAGLKSFAGRMTSAAALGEAGRNEAVSPLAWAQLLSALLSGSEGETFESLAEALDIQDPDTDRLGQAHAAMATELESLPGRPVLTASGYWMVWPVPLKKEFTALAEARYRIRFKNLGSAGIGSRAEIDGWTERRTDGRIANGVAGLAKSVPVLATVVCAVRFEFDGGTAPGGNLAFLGSERKAVFLDVRQRFSTWSSGGWDFVVLTGAGGALELRLAAPPAGTRLDAAVRRLASMPDPGHTPSEGVVRLPAVDVAVRQDAGPWLTKVGLGRLTAGAVDFRGLSNEMSGKNRADYLATTKVEWGGAPGADGPIGEPTLTVDRPFAFTIVHAKTGLPLVVGAVADPTAVGP